MKTRIHLLLMTVVAACAAETAVKPAPIPRAVISEGWDRVRQSALHTKVGDSWRTVATGTTLGPYKELSLDPVSAQQFRLSITAATDVPSIWEFCLSP
jgi:hypothetical protein